MSFSVWFKQWVNSFIKLLTFDKKRYRSEAQRKRERERRKPRNFNNACYTRKKKNPRKRRSSYTVQNERFINAFLKFTAISLCAVLLPFGLLDWARKSIRVRRSSASIYSPRKTAPKPKATAPVPPTKLYAGHAAKDASRKETPPHHPRASAKASDVQKSTGPQEDAAVMTTGLFTASEPEIAASPAEEPTVTEPNENTPKSTPKNEGDQYIRKRMIIAGSYYCDKAVLDTLSVGSFIDLEAEPENPYDKNAIRLLHDGQKIGYVAKKDLFAFSTCLRLKRKIYGVITDIFKEHGQIKYEYETWFESV